MKLIEKEKRVLYKGFREGERGKLFSVHKWALRTRVEKIYGIIMVGCRNQRVAGR